MILIEGEMLQGTVYSSLFIHNYLLSWLVGTSPVCNAIERQMWEVENAMNKLH